MVKAISALEGIVSDIAFSGLSNINGALYKRMIQTKNYCEALGLETASELLSDIISDGTDTEVFSKLCCYLECLKGIQN